MEKCINIKEIEDDIQQYVFRKYGVKFQIITRAPVPEATTGEKQNKAEDNNLDVSSIQFDIKPEELKAYLDEYMVKQDEAKKVLATKICTHLNRIKRFELNRSKKVPDVVGLIKNNIIMVGPTGVGKTFLVKLIAKKIGVPFVKGDATKFSETGYVGGDVEDLVRELVHEAKGDIELAQYGIIYMDEVDKIAASHNLIGPDVSRTGVQRALLKPMEETEVELKVPHDPISQIEAIQEYQKTGKYDKKKISTKHILFIMSGAFNGLGSIVKKRIHRQGIGFGAEIHPKDENAEILKYLKAEDLIQYGFESEFIGRLPVITVFEHLEKEDLYQILHNSKSPIIIGKKQDFKAYGIDLLFEDEALRKIAENAFAERTGARGLVSAVERVLMKYEHSLPSTNIRRLLVTPKMVDDPAGELDKILSCREDQERDAAFQRQLAKEEVMLESLSRKKIHEWKASSELDFSDERIKLIVKHSLASQTDPEIVVSEILVVQKEAQEFATDFSVRNGLKVSFSDEAIDWLAEKAWQGAQDTTTYLKQSLINYDHGLKLIKEKTGEEQFIIPAKCIAQPEKYLNRLIQEAYK
jgi:ATP-dependent Clp protease ATP-binding subunit ClpX